MKIVRLDPWGRPLAHAVEQDAIAGASNSIVTGSTLGDSLQLGTTPIGLGVGAGAGVATALAAKALGAAWLLAIPLGLAAVPAVWFAWAYAHDQSGTFYWPVKASS